MGEIAFSILMLIIGAALEGAITIFIIKYLQKQDKKDKNVRNDDNK